MKDIQNQEDRHRINIKKVGVKTISYPITVLDKAHSRQDTIASVNMYVNLPHHFKGTHMSRFVEILNRYHGAIDIGKFHNILAEMKGKLESEAAHIEMSFAYFMSDSNEAAVSLLWNRNAPPRPAQLIVVREAPDSDVTVMALPRKSTL